MTEQCQVSLQVNGQDVSLQVAPFTSLAQLLRENLGLTGTKISCNEGECGSCTVIMDEQVVNSCLVLAPQADGAEVWTIEGLTPKEGLHPMQEAFLKEGAVQCGYCTPGFILTAVALLRENPDPTDEEIIEAIAGNLCRCTGYHKIVTAIRSCAQAIREAEMSV
jgi:aerobic carbon-monoxide dehydrogenase small subunit